MSYDNGITNFNPAKPCYEPYDPLTMRTNAIINLAMLYEKSGSNITKKFLQDAMQEVLNGMRVPMNPPAANDNVVPFKRK